MNLLKGFTLTELLIVVAIVAVIGAIGVPTYQGYIADSKNAVAKQSLQSIYLEQSNYFSDNSRYYNSGSGNRSYYINRDLFGGRKVVDESSSSGHYFYVNGSSTYFYAYAVCRTGGAQTFRIDKNGALTEMSICR